MNKEFEYYISKIENKIGHSTTREEIFNFYNTYKDKYVFDDFMNVNCQGCKNLYCCINCDDCENCKMCINCKNCKKCRMCEDCEHCKECDFCVLCHCCDDCQNLNECLDCLENNKLESEFSD